MRQEYRYVRDITRIELLFEREPPIRSLTREESALEDIMDREDDHVLKHIDTLTLQFQAEAEFGDQW